LSPAFRREFHVSESCLQSHSAQPLSHDNLFHSVLGLLDIATIARNASLDVLNGCEGPRESALAAAAP